MEPLSFEGMHADNISFSEERTAGGFLSVTITTNEECFGEYLTREQAFTLYAWLRFLLMQEMDRPTPEEPKWNDPDFGSYLWDRVSGQ